MTYTRAELHSLGLAGVGENVTIDRSVRFFGAEHIRIGSDVRIDCFAVLSGGPPGFTIGDHVHIATAVAVFGGSAKMTIGDFAGLSPRVTVFTATDDFTGAHLTGPTIPDDLRGVTAGPVTIGRHVIVGAGTVILPNVTVHDGAAVGALSLVRRDVEAFTIVAGNPLRTIGPRDRAILELERKLRERETD